MFPRKPIILGPIIEGILLRLIFTDVLASIQLQSKALEDRCSLLFISLSLVLSTLRIYLWNELKSLSWHCNIKLAIPSTNPKLGSGPLYL